MDSANVSIHGLRGEPDLDKYRFHISGGEVSIHGLRGEPDDITAKYLTFTVTFQSTGSAGSPTRFDYSIGGEGGFNPRAPRGARLRVLVFAVAFPRVSIHGLRGEPDCQFCPAQTGIYSFQSTGSAGSPTIFNRHSQTTIAVSIHGLRGEPDKIGCSRSRSNTRFNPRAPRGARLCKMGRKSANWEFQSTGSAGSPTLKA